MPDPSTSGTPQFTPKQRSELSKLGLLNAQIDALEATLLLSRAWLQKSPTMQDVREELRKVSRPIERAESALSKLLEAGPTAPAKYEAQHLIEDAEAVSRALAMAKAQMKHAEPDRKRGPKTASVLPVARIHQALMRGWRLCRDRAKPTASKADLLRHYIELSSSPNSPFCRIVGICYSAMGFSTSDGEERYPERAIKNYIAWRRKSTEARRRKISSEVVTLRK